jgi:hypothetical protein
MFDQDPADGSNGFDVRHLSPGGRLGQEPNQLALAINDRSSAGSVVTVEVDHEQTIGVGLHDSSPGDAQ